MRESNIKNLSLLGLLLAPILLSGCATVATPTTPPERVMQEGDVDYNIDPFEPYNRAIFSFNNQFNRYVAKPINKAYVNTVPVQARKGIGNVFRNLGSISAVGNDMLQNNWTWALQDTTRFLLNSTLGIFGIFDVASDVGLTPRTQTFGLTMAKWGVTYSPYLILPVIGPTTVRGAFGMIPDYYVYPVNYIQPQSDKMVVQGIHFVQLTSYLLPKERLLNSMAVDPYIAMRNAFLQNADYLVQQVQAGAQGQDENN